MTNGARKPSGIGSLFRPLLAERVATTIKKGAHVLVEGSLVSSTYEQPNGKGKKSKTSKITSWSVRADVVVSSTAASPSRRHRHPVRMLRHSHPKQAMRLPSSVSPQGPSDDVGGPFFLFLH